MAFGVAMWCSLFYFYKIITAADVSCQQGVNCHLPDCFCSTFEHSMDRNDIPQMVYFGFDGAVNEDVAKHYDFMFRRTRINPNGCPVGITLYISHLSTDYGVVKRYYNRGFELAVHSVNHRSITTDSKLQQEARDQRDNIAQFAAAPQDDIVGWRSPSLLTRGNAQFDILQHLNYTYDISMTYTRLGIGDPNPWPFTLDYGWPFQESLCTPSCPDKKHNGFWEVPVNAMILNDLPCAYADGCFRMPSSADDAYRYVMDNFQSHYHGNRAPFGISMHASWFYHPFTRDGLDQAIREMLSHRDVYIVTVQQVLEWMKNPVKLSDIRHFDAWSCSIKDKIVHGTLLPKLLAAFLGIILTSFGVISVILIWKQKSSKYAPLGEMENTNPENE
ncbi:chitin deacetylase 8-like [Ylistrum balloti]|uniref:chitin deacetylase 8-like n=1 Tax=Ylistrum balloti TaxID=509963 RepID=UPI002905817A|nr:chitin deacetylase 8-like [Ylistrum balloti]